MFCITVIFMSKEFKLFQIYPLFQFNKYTTHTSKKRGLRSTFWLPKMLQNLPYLWKKKTHVVFFLFHLEQLWVLPYKCPGLGFSFSISMANFEAFWGSKSWAHTSLFWGVGLLTYWRLFGCAIQGLDNVKKVSHNKLNIIFYSIHFGVNFRCFNFFGIYINGDDVITGFGELNCIPPNATKCINNYITTTSFCNMNCNLFWSNWKPGFGRI